MNNFTNQIETVKGFLKKIFSWGTIDTESSHNAKNNTRITNEILLQELVTHFNERMKELSVRRRILYPMSFNILMHPDDYNQTEQSFPFILPEIVAEFYASITREKENSAPDAKYAPPAKYWFFQFSACEVDGNSFIQPGQIVTTGNLVTFDITKALQDNMHEANVRLSVKCQNSSTNDNNINMNALLGMNILGGGIFTYDFDMDLSEDTNRIKAVSGRQSTKWAQLRWSMGSHELIYDMMDEYIDISGSTDSRKTRNIFHIPSDAIGTTHVQIKYDRKNNSFWLAAFAKTRLNEREVPVSNAVPHWIPIPKYNTKIFMNDSISVEFNASTEL